MNPRVVVSVAPGIYWARFVLGFLCLAFGLSIGVADEVPRKDFNAAVSAVVDECLAKAGVTETSTTLEQMSLIRARVEGPLEVLPDKLLTHEYLDWFRENSRAALSPRQVQSLVALNPPIHRTLNAEILEACRKGFPILAEMDFHRADCAPLEARVKEQSLVIKSLLLERIAANNRAYIHRLEVRDHVMPLADAFLSELASNRARIPLEVQRDVVADQAALLVLRSVEQARLDSLEAYQYITSDLFQVAGIAGGIKMDTGDIGRVTEEAFAKAKEGNGDIHIIMNATSQLSGIYLTYYPLCFGQVPNPPVVRGTDDRDPAKHPENFIEIPIPPELRKRFE
jgi:hypothetical protein